MVPDALFALSRNELKEKLDQLDKIREEIEGILLLMDTVDEKHVVNLSEETRLFLFRLDV